MSSVHFNFGGPEYFCARFYDLSLQIHFLRLVENVIAIESIQFYFLLDAEIAMRPLLNLLLQIYVVKCSV